MRFAGMTFVAVMMLSGQALAKDTGALACPPRIEVAAQKLEKKAPAGFTSMNETKPAYTLRWVGVYSGKEPVAVEPFRSSESSSEWMLVDNGKQPYFLMCGYNHSSVLLKKPLPATLKTCRVSPQPDPALPKGPQLLHKFDCE
jgi:hypothetical protein